VDKATKLDTTRLKEILAQQEHQFAETKTA